jgi:sulfur-oxidizing protein SoxB
MGTLGLLGFIQPGSLFAADNHEAQPGKPAKITLLQINDCHGYLDSHLEWFPAPQACAYRMVGGYARIATLVKKIRAETQGRVLFCDNGDTFHGTYPVVKSRGEVLLPMLNQLGLNAMTVHWDFAYGPQRMQELAAALKYPVLAINAYHAQTGQRFFAPYVVQEVGGLKIGIIGIASNITDKIMPPHFRQDLRFTDGRAELPGFIQEVREKETVDLVVVLSHLGFPQDMALLQEVSGVDVLLSGHTHNRLFHPVVQGKTLVIQSGNHGAFLGRLDLEIQDRKVVGYQHKLIEVAESIEPDPAVNALVQTALAPYADDLKRVVGQVSTALNRNANLECTMDNFLLEAIREAAGTPLAFSNGWRWGAPVHPGPITQNDLYNILPMPVPISTVDLTGSELIAMLEENLERTFSADPFHQMGGYVKRCLGLTVYIKVENPPGTRIQKLFVGSDEVQPDQVYRAAYLSEQAVAANYGRNRRDLPQPAHEAMLAYLETHTPASAELRGSVVGN